MHSFIDQFSQYFLWKCTVYDQSILPRKHCSKSYPIFRVEYSLTDDGKLEKKVVVHSSIQHSDNDDDDDGANTPPTRVSMNEDTTAHHDGM